MWLLQRVSVVQGYPVFPVPRNQLLLQFAAWNNRPPGAMVWLSNTSDRRS